jgi:Mycolic acid cyclopropane synthetase
MRTALNNDLLWHLHDLWPEQTLPGSALLSKKWAARIARRLARVEQTARVRIARDELRSRLPPTNGAGGPTFRVRSPRALGHLLRAPGQLGLGRAYVSGDIEVDDLDAALELLDGYTVPPLDARAKARLAAAAVRAGALRSVPRAPAAELRPRGRRHSPERDRRAVAHHYDVSTEFFRLFLGESMTYSCAIFSHGAQTLDARTTSAGVSSR